MRKRKVSGYSLLEILVGSALLSLLLGALFTSYAAVQRTQLRQSENLVVQQLVSSVSPLRSALEKSLVAEQTMVTLSGDTSPSTCQRVYGYYGTLLQQKKAVQLEFAKDMEITVLGLVPNQTQGFRWQKKVYSRDTIGTSDAGHYGALVERTYEITDPSAEWPATLTSCDGKNPWATQPKATRYLTDDSLDVTHFFVRYSAPVVNESGRIQTARAPFLSFQLAGRERNGEHTPPSGVSLTFVPSFLEGIIDE